MNKKHIIFDFDGVLGNTPLLSGGIVEQLHPEVPLIRYLIDHHLGNVFEDPVVPFTPETTTLYYKLYNESLAVRHVAASCTTIVELATNYHLHIVTSNCEAAITRVLTEAGVAVHFGSILGKEAHASKVEKFKRLFAEYDFSAADSLLITDTLGDLMEASKVGLPTVAVTFGFHPPEVLQRGNPTRMVSSWPDVIRAIESLLVS